MLNPQGRGYELIVVGASWGGLAALRTLVSKLPASLPMAVTLVQHRHRDSDHHMSLVLQSECALAVCEVEDKMPLEPGRIYIAPPDYHTLIERGYFSLSTEAPVRYSRPSIDVTFLTAADSYGPRMVGVVLTGANADGSEGLRRIIDRGGLAMIQNPATAESATMPDAAMRAVPEALVMELAEMGQFIASLSASAAERGSA